MGVSLGSGRYPVNEPQCAQRVQGVGNTTKRAAALRGERIVGPATVLATYWQPIVRHGCCLSFDAQDEKRTDSYLGDSTRTGRGRFPDCCNRGIWRDEAARTCDPKSCSPVEGFTFGAELSRSCERKAGVSLNLSPNFRSRPANLRVAPRPLSLSAAALTGRYWLVPIRTPQHTWRRTD